MNKTLIAGIAALLAAATMLSPAAEAGFKVGIGIGIGLPLGGFPKHNTYNPPRERPYVARKAIRKVAKKKSSPVKQEAPAEVAAENESSSISVAALPATDAAPVTDTSAEVSRPAEADTQADTATTATPADPAAPKQDANATPPVAAQAAVVEQKPEAPPAGDLKAAKKLDCKKFFPSVGMTVTVSCE